MVDSTDTVTERKSLHQMVESLTEIAKAGLGQYYTNADKRLPYSATIGPDGEWKLSGVSLRYAAISQIGLGRWIEYHPEDRTHLPDLWPRIVDNRNGSSQIGDLVLALWAGIESKASDSRLFADAMSAAWQDHADTCNAVELAWILQACTLATCQEGLQSYVQPLTAEVKNRLLNLFQPQQSLFQRHNRAGFGQAISRRIACFADQVYPVLALCAYGQFFEDNQCIEIAQKTIERICQLQGPLGQWWWHYDTLKGEVCEEYPVFSVHQDAMAPMAIMASDRLTGQNHSREIECGLRWLLGQNELNECLVLHDAGLIWRDIEKRELAKISRFVRALLCVANLKLLHTLAGRSFLGFCINHECRPYHLGWILYAWADYDSRPNLLRPEECD
jgi:hypothetical protein